MTTNDFDGADCGTIKKITLKNFMCHDNLIVDLKAGINVITGSNGSGKSAILTGLIFALGGRSTSTSRAKSLKDFIKLNRKDACVSVVLHNKGQEAYRHDVYGDSITIQRHINAVGNSTYKILSDNNSVKSRNKDEVVSILEAFNIQVENPINILNQESSKTFLNSQDPRVKYTLFSRATHLEEVQQLYNYSKDELKVNIEKLVSAENTLKEHRNKLNSIASTIKINDEMENLDIKLQSLRNNLIMKEIAELEEQQKQNQKQIDDETVRINNVQETEFKMIEKINQEQQQLKFIEAQIRSLQQELDEISRDRENRRNNIESNSHIIQSKSLEIETMESSLANYNKAINNFLKSASSNIDNESEKNEKKRETILQEVNHFANTVNIHEENLENVRINIRGRHDQSWSLKQDKSNLENYRSSLTQQLENKKRALESAKRSNNDNLCLFGNNTKNFLKIINDDVKRGLYDKPPVGPIGSLITVKDDRWIPTVENFFKEQLLSYIVFSYPDKTRFIKTFKSLCKSERIPNVIISTYQTSLYNYKPNAPNTKFPLLLDMIECNNCNVLNVLMDQMNIEKILLIESISVAREVMIPKPPPKTLKAFTLEGDEFLYVNGKTRFYSSYPSTPRYLARNFQNMIKDLTNEYTEIDDKIKQSLSEIKELNTQIDSLQATINELSAEEQRLLKLLTEKKSIIVRLEAELGSIEVTNKTSFELELIVIRQNYSKLQIEFDQKTQELNRLKAQNESLKQSYSNIDIRHSSVTTKFEEIKGQERVFNDTISELKRELNICQSKLARYKDKVLSLKSAITQIDKSIKAKREKIVGDCQNDPKQSKEEIELEIKRFELAKKTHHYDPEEVAKLKEEYETFSKIVNSQHIEIKVLHKITEQLKLMLKDRFLDYVRLRRRVVKQTDEHFQELLQKRKYHGSLTFDHEAKKLIIHASARGSDSDKNDTKTLSGGERSFSTLSLVVSLWNTIDSPFRCLDEFDVFMDLVNRKIGLGFLLQFSSSRPGQQIIIITPQDTSDLYAKSGVTIIRMDNPR